MYKNVTVDTRKIDVPQPVVQQRRHGDHRLVGLTFTIACTKGLNLLLFTFYLHFLFT